MSIYLGIDVGTQSVKVLLYDADARAVVASKSSALELISKDDGSREQIASWWLDALRDCLAQLKQDNGADVVKSVRALAVSGQQHGFVPLAKNGEVLAPVKLWCDTATTNECAEIHAAFGGRQACIDQVGNAIVPGYTAPKIRWLRNHMPEQYQQLATILLPHDYINYYLSGELAMEYGDASGTGMLDIHKRRWHSGLLQAMDADRDLSTALPKLLDADSQLGQLSSKAADELGLEAGIAIATGGGDNMMAAIGTGSLIPGRTTISLGTSGTVFAYSDAPVVDPEAQLAAFCSSTGGWLPLLCTMNCTVATEMSRELFNIPLEELEQHVESVDIGCNGVSTLPFYNGERSPDLPNGKGCIMGLSPTNTTADTLLRSAMEGACFGLRNGLDAFQRLNVTTDNIRLTGGGAGSAAWRQMIADNFSVPVDVLQLDEGAAFGAALQACSLHQKQTGQNIDIAELAEQHLKIDTQRHCEPEASAADAYSEAYEQYQRYVELLRPEFSSTH